MHAVQIRSLTGWPLVWKTWKCQGIWQLGQEVCIPKTEAEFWKDDRLSTADWDDVANKVVSLAYTRSVKDDEPTIMPRLACMWFKIQSIATQNRARASMQPCLTPDMVRNLVDSFPPWWTQEPVCSCRATIRSRRMFAIPLLCSAFHSAWRSTESKAALMSRNATCSGQSNSQWISPPADARLRLRLL